MAPQQCPGCGRAAQPEDRFCQGCGAQIHPPQQDAMQALHDYVAECRRRGISDDLIHQQMLAAGWQKEVITLVLLGNSPESEESLIPNTASTASSSKVPSEPEEKDSPVLSSARVSSRPGFVEFDNASGQDIASLVPMEVRPNLLRGEKAYYFTYVDRAQKAGCFGRGEGAKHWILISDKRVVYDATVRHEVVTYPGKAIAYEREVGAIPMEKISFVGVHTTLISEGYEGCNGQRPLVLLTISSGGSSLEIPIPTEKEAHRLQTKIQEIQQETQMRARNG